MQRKSAPADRVFPSSSGAEVCFSMRQAPQTKRSAHRFLYPFAFLIVSLDGLDLSPDHRNLVNELSNAFSELLQLQSMAIRVRE